MERRGVVLRGIARVLNASGSGLLTVYDAVASIGTRVLPGERGILKARIRDYEKKTERLYVEIGKEVAQRGLTAQPSAAEEAGIRLAAEYRVEIEKIRQRIRDIEEEEKAANEAAKHSAGEAAATEAPVAREAPPGAETEEAKEIVAETVETRAQEIDMPSAGSSAPKAGRVLAGVVMDTLADAAETPAHEIKKDTFESGAPVAGETPPGAGTEAEADTEVSENMLKGDLLKLCREKGIKADKNMAKAEVVDLLRLIQKGK